MAKGKFWIWIQKHAKWVAAAVGVALVISHFWLGWP